MKIHIIGGGTMIHVRPHFSVCAPAFGTFARAIAEELHQHGLRHEMHLTRMAGGSNMLETNYDLACLADDLVADQAPKLVFWTPAVADWKPSWGSQDLQRKNDILGHGYPLGAVTTGAEAVWGKTAPRLKTRHPLGGGQGLHLNFEPTEKIINKFRSNRAGVVARKDIFLVACKTTTGATDDEMFLAGLKMLKDSSCNLVLVNDIHRRQNMIVTPEQARYCVTMNRALVAKELVDMATARSTGTFTRSTVVPGEPVSWHDDRVFPALRAVVDHCIANGAYKDILNRDATVGHFAQKLDSNRFLTSRRNSNFNRMAEVGLVEVEAGADNTQVTAHGFKPSVGGQSQRIIFNEHEGFDCIFHAHVPLKPGAGDGTDGYGAIGKATQWGNECGSHQCGQQTSNNLQEVAPGIKAVFLSNHGPNIVFQHDADPQRVIDYIDSTFDLSRHTGQDSGVVPA